MNEHMAKINISSAITDVPKAVFEIANVTRVITEKENIFR